MGSHNSNAIIIRELAKRRAALAKACNRPIPEGGTLARLVKDHREKKRQEIEAIDKQLSSMKNDLLIRKRDNIAYRCL